MRRLQACITYGYATRLINGKYILVFVNDDDGVAGNRRFVSVHLVYDSIAVLHEVLSCKLLRI